MTTYNQIVKAFEAFCVAHKQVNTFFSGKEWNFQAETNVYPSVIMTPQPSTIGRGGITLTFNVFVADILNADRTNLDEVYSDTLLIMTDIVSYFKDSEGEEGIDFTLNDENVAVEPFEETLDDVVAGWAATINISFPYSGNLCDVPVTP